MAAQRISNLLTYKYRHSIGIFGLAALLFTLLYVVTTISPGGISKSEQDSVVQASALQTEMIVGEFPEQIAHAPYHLLQRLTTDLMDVSPLSIKLPSLLLAVLSIVTLYALLRLWFRRNVAVITTLVAITSSQFLLVSQLGTPRITYIFLSITMLFCASMLTQAQRFRVVWLLVTALISAVAMYTPLMWYFVVAMFIIALIHPHSRFIILRIEKWALLLAGVIFTLIIVPLIMAIASQPSVALRFLGFGADGALPDLTKLNDLVAQYVGFTSSSSTEMITPVYGLGIILLMLLGLYRLFSAKYTAKSYILTAWLLLLIPAIILLPTATTLTFAPIILLIAFAFDYLFRSWYGLFPRNPYARIFGLIPLTILIVTLSMSSINRFVYGYHYDQSAAATFTKDVSQVQKTVGSFNENRPVNLVLANDEMKFYQYYVKVSGLENVKIIDKNNNQTAQKAVSSGTIVVSRIKLSTAVPSDIIVSSSSDNSARFYIYK